MVEQLEILSRGGVYLAKLSPTKDAEVGKVRPIILLNSQAILNKKPPIIFVCPLSSKSYSEFSGLHFELAPRDSLKVRSYALLEHCRSISLGRVVYPRLAQVTDSELNGILHKLQILIGI